MPFLFLSPSTQYFNPYVTTGDERYWMNALADEMMPQPAIAPATTTRVRMMLFWSLQVNFICIPPDCVPERFRIAARFSPMVRDACSIPRCISFCKHFLSFFDNFVKSDGNICTAPQNGVS